MKKRRTYKRATWHDEIPPPDPDAMVQFDTGSVMQIKGLKTDDQSRHHHQNVYVFPTSLPGGEEEYDATKQPTDVAVVSTDGRILLMTSAKAPIIKPGQQPFAVPKHLLPSKGEVDILISTDDVDDRFLNYTARGHGKKDEPKTVTFDGEAIGTPVANPVFDIGMCDIERLKSLTWYGMNPAVLIPALKAFGEEYVSMAVGMHNGNPVFLLAGESKCAIVSTMLRGGSMATELDTMAHLSRTVVQSWAAAHGEAWFKKSAPKSKRRKAQRYGVHTMEHDWQTGQPMHYGAQDLCTVKRKSNDRKETWA